MATRSRICKLMKEGIAAIYCHNDGYIEHNGKILFEHYNTSERVDELLKLGDLSVLGAEIGEKHDFSLRGLGCCTAYGRDRGEDGTEAILYTTMEDFARSINVPYVYLYAVDRWLVTVNGIDFVPLGKELNLRHEI